MLELIINLVSIRTLPHMVALQAFMVVLQIFVPVTAISSFLSNLINQTDSNSGCCVLLRLQIFELWNFVFIDIMKLDQKFCNMNQKFSIMEICDKY